MSRIMRYTNKGNGTRRISFDQVVCLCCFDGGPDHEDVLFGFDSVQDGKILTPQCFPDLNTPEGARP